jgi:erythronate-4-phosphate dehydrogenase
MRIVADENIPCVAEAFGSLGEVHLTPGRSLSADDVREADVLLVRSVTPVGAKLLEGSRVRFVGTATIGTDHVDTAYLEKAGIAFAAAPGSNANSVAEYTTAALLVVAQRRGYTLAGRSIGVIGVGNVGSRVAQKATALGMKVLLNDPPLQRATGDARYLPLEDLLACDFLTLHVPLERGGPDPTWHMVDGEFLSRMKPGSVLLNSSRGAVVDNAALRAALRADLLGALDAGRVDAAVLDVWEGEPDIRTDLLERVTLGTPHIAGYSLDGKVNGTEMIYAAACRRLGVEPCWTAAQGLPRPEFPEMFIRAEGRPIEEVVREAVLTAYPIEEDDEALREILTLPAAARPARFDELRKTYPVRREFRNVTIHLSGAAEGALDAAEVLKKIGFVVAPASD